jgi:hypothetical protein
MIRTLKAASCIPDNENKQVVCEVVAYVMGYVSQPKKEFLIARHGLEPWTFGI